MIMGIPTPAFLAFIVQPVMIAAAIIYAVKYKDIIKKPPFDFYTKLEEAVKQEEEEEEEK